MKLSLELGPELRQESSRPRRGRRQREPDAWEFRRPQHWTQSGVAIPLLTVLTPDQLEARSMVYLLQYTTGDIDCGIIELVPVWRPRRRRKK